ncbi:hypothetical protein SASPL_107744 [Salvia splendens]|uniref:Uncharacterized protein n=1 Tax=Salvia splendens TaxID=180675 RepID=A0A8X9A4Q5_SALSN|nr:hypothetical protein SASPL_107744 [Salvia splendens]
MKSEWCSHCARRCEPYKDDFKISCNTCGRVLFDGIYGEKNKIKKDDWYASDSANLPTSSVSTLSNIVIDGSESDSDGSSSSTNSSAEQ